MWIKGLDEKNNKILSLLLQDAKMSYSEIGKIVGLSRTAVKNRVSDMEQSGVIEGYKAVIRPHNSPQMITFVISVETTAQHFEDVKTKLAAATETVTILQTTGNNHLLAICMAKSASEVRLFVRKICNEFGGVTSVNTQAVLDVVKGDIVCSN